MPAFYRRHNYQEPPALAERHDNGVSKPGRHLRLKLTRWQSFCRLLVRVLTV